MRLDEISRRGFIGAMGAGVASSVVPAEEIKGFLKSFTQEAGGSKKLKIFSELLKHFDINDINGFYEFASGETSFSELLNTEELDALANKLISSGYTPEDSDVEDSHDIVNDWAQTGEYDGNIYDAASDIIGHQINYSQALEIISKGGIDPDEFFDYNDGLGEFIKDAYLTTLRKYNSQITADNVVRLAKDASLSSNLIRLAGLVSSVVKKLIGNSPEPTLPEPIQPPSQKVPQLPAPRDKDEIEGMSNIDRIKDLAGIQRK